MGRIKKYMKNNKGITFIKMLIAIILVIGIMGYILYTKKTTKTEEKIENKISSLWIWDVDSISLTDLDAMVEYLKINTIYAQDSDFEKAKYKQLIKYANDKDIDLYIVDGARSWIYNSKDSKITDLIEKVNNYNKQGEYKLAGVCLDIEFFLDEEYKSSTDDGKKQIIDTFVDIMIEKYKLAQKYDLKYVTCIARWFDDKNAEAIEKLIKEGCDYVQLMNYRKDDMIENMQFEVEMAQKYNKQIEQIFELQIPNEKNSVTEKDTFYNDGIAKCLEKQTEIEAYYNYSNLGYSYHYYKPLVYLIGQVTDVKNKYDLELYPSKDRKICRNRKSIYCIR